MSKQLTTALMGCRQGVEEPLTGSEGLQEQKMCSGGAGADKAPGTWGSLPSPAPQAPGALPRARQ